ncbi:MAG: beta-ketoacyl-ACP synthase II [Halobacteriales archaeon]|nr:beta-ketoacyl-ACP synthase II [Halobacteriales archaeon]
MRQRAVITGVGAITPAGSNAEESWDAISHGESGVTTLTRVDAEAANLSSQIAGEVSFDTDCYDCIDERRMGRYAQLGIAASLEAVEDADIDFDEKERELDAGRVGVSMGSGIGGFPEIEEGVTGDRVDPYFALRFLPNLAAGYVSELIDAQGPNRAPATACAASTHAIGDALTDIRTGEADIMIAGGCEATLAPTAIRGFDAMRALSTRNDAPTKASRPFDADRDGFVMAEGAGVIVLEAAEHAAARGTEPIAELTGFARTADAHHPTKPPDDAHGLRQSMETAIDDADRPPHAIDHINAHATSTPRGDQHEATAIRSVFDDPPLVTSTKSMIGHTLGASGAIEAITCAKAVQNGIRPPTINYETPDDACDVPVITTQQTADVDVVLSNSAGFGGSNGTLVFEQISEDVTAA